MARSRSPLEYAAIIAVGGSVLAVAIPAFVRNLQFSKLSEPVDGLDRLVTAAVVYSKERPQNISFPPSAPLTPEEVPRGETRTDPEGTWNHLTWRSLDFGFPAACPQEASLHPTCIAIPHAFAFKFDSALEPETGSMRLLATAHGDLDGDGVLSTFEVRAERVPGQEARVLPGMFIDRQIE